LIPPYRGVTTGASSHRKGMMSKRKKHRFAPPVGALCSLKRLKLLMKRGHKRKDIIIHAVSAYTYTLYNVPLTKETFISKNGVLCVGDSSHRVNLDIYNVTRAHTARCYLFENYWLALAYMIRLQKGEIQIVIESNDHN
jgi:hypothetical protein